MDIVGRLRRALRVGPPQQLLTTCSDCGAEVYWPSWAYEGDGTYHGSISAHRGVWTVNGQTVHRCRKHVPERLGPQGQSTGPLVDLDAGDILDAPEGGEYLGAGSVLRHTCGGGVRITEDLTFGKARCPLDEDPMLAAVCGGDDHICIGGVVVHRCEPAAVE